MDAKSALCAYRTHAVAVTVVRTAGTHEWHIRVKVYNCKSRHCVWYRYLNEWYGRSTVLMDETTKRVERRRQMRQIQNKSRGDRYRRCKMRRKQTQWAGKYSRATRDAWKGTEMKDESKRGPVKDYTTCHKVADRH